MALCCICGREFNPSTARRSMGQRYGAGIYNDMFPAADVCEYCAELEIGTANKAGAEIIRLMGPGWDYD